MNFDKRTFNKESINFLIKIEKDYSKEINIIKSDLGVGNHGFSEIISGIPTIKINSNYSGSSEGLIIHEAYHLRLRFDGCPDVSFAASPHVPLSQQNQDYLKWFYHKSWDKITHYYFYPKIHEDLKINPYIDFETELRSYLNQKHIPGLNDNTKDITLGCYYLQAWVETRNDKLLYEFEDFLKKIHSGIGIRLGKELIQLFKQNPSDRIDDFKQIFIKTFDACHRGHARLTLQTTQSENKGNYVQNYSVFSMWKA